MKLHLHTSYIVRDLLLLDSKFMILLHVLKKIKVFSEPDYTSEC